MLTESTGQVQIDVPRDRAGTFEPPIVKKRQRRLTGADEIVLSLYAEGLTMGETSAHFAGIDGAYSRFAPLLRVLLTRSGWQWLAAPGCACQPRAWPWAGTHCC